jgi:hypothetical protein
MEKDDSHAPENVVFSQKTTVRDFRKDDISGRTSQRLGLVTH